MSPRKELKSIAPEKWPELRDQYKLDWPRHEISYNTLQNYINWINYDPDIKQLEIFVLNDTWRENGTCIIIDRFEMFVFTLEDPNLSLQCALQLINWNYSYKIFCVHESHRLVLDKVFKLFAVKLASDHCVTCYKLSKKDSICWEICTPDGLYLKELDIEHASIVNEDYPLRCEGTEYALKRMIAWNPSVGLFNKSGELLAWSLFNTTGCIGPIQVAKDHLRKGYGTIVTTAMVRQLTDFGMSCYAGVFKTNVVSHAMFKKLGAKPMGCHFLVRTRAKKLVEYSQ